MKDLCFSVFILRTLYGTEDFEHPEHAGAFQHAHHGIEYQRIYRRFYDVFDQTGRKHRKVALAVYLRQPERTEQHVYKQRYRQLRCKYPPVDGRLMIEKTPVYRSRQQAVQGQSRNPCAVRIQKKLYDIHHRRKKASYHRTEQHVYHLIRQTRHSDL